MSQLLPARNKLFLAKQPLIFITACAVNILIFYLILQLVSNEHEPLNRIDPLNFLDFINYRQTPKIEEHKVKEKEQELPEEAEELPPLIYHNQRYRNQSKLRQICQGWIFIFHCR